MSSVNTVLLHNGIPIRIQSFDNVYDFENNYVTGSSGFLVSFVIDNINYNYFSKSDFRKEHWEYNNAKPGYYKEDSFFEYKTLKPPYKKSG